MPQFVTEVLNGHRTISKGKLKKIRKEQELPYGTEYKVFLRIRFLSPGAEEHLLLRGDKPLPLAPKAFDLLIFLVKNQGRLLTKDQIMQDAV